MATKKKAAAKKSAKKEKPLIINGSWEDVIKASVSGNPKPKKMPKIDR
ncbi:MAG: hypothetical protein JST49_04605 [Bacteroidetes bacterium]|nr:hypothetical protein [Bacteroidota bacterium]